MAATGSRSVTSLASGSGQSTDPDRIPPTGNYSPAEMNNDVEKLAPSAPPGPPQGPPGGGVENELYKPKTLRFWFTMLCNFMALFLVALDRTIIATAVPRITDEFQRLGDIAWYGSVYMLTTASFQLIFGRIYKFYDLKWTYLTSIVVFEIGSAICGAAPTSVVLIIGRAIAGAGSAGIFSGSMQVMIPMVPLHKRPAFQGLFGIVFGVASVMGPLVGGAFTSGVSWRWCFWINLPIGAVVLLFMIFFWTPPREKKPPASISEQVKRLDPIGMFFFLPALVSLLIALQWGGSEYEWSSWRIIVLFCVFAAGTIAFIVVQILKPKTAMVPGRVVSQRSVAFGTSFTFFLAGSMLMMVYYVPIWFQTVQHRGPFEAGIATIPLVLSLVVSSIISGFVTQKIGYYVPSMLIAPSIMSIGEGLMSTLQPDSGSSHWIAFQFLTGFGLGFGMQVTGIAVQAVLPKPDISTGIAINFFAQQLGGAVFTSVGQTVLTNLLVSQLDGVPGFTRKLITDEGATQLSAALPAEFRHLVAEAYNYACQRIFLVAMGLAFASLLCAFGMEWVNIKKGKHGPPGGGPPGAAVKGGPAAPGGRPVDGEAAAVPNGSQPGSPTQGAGGPLFAEEQRLKDEKKQAIREGRKSGVLTKPPPSGSTSSARSSIQDGVVNVKKGSVGGESSTSSSGNSFQDEKKRERHSMPPPVSMHNTSGRNSSHHQRRLSSSTLECGHCGGRMSIIVQSE